MKKSTLAAAALSLAFAGVAAAQAPQNPATNPGSQKVAPPMKFSGLDTNRDGRVSKDEVKAHVELSSSFATLDTNKDSYLSESEYGKWETPAPASPPPADRSRDGMTPPASSPGAPGAASPQTPPTGN